MGQRCSKDAAVADPSIDSHSIQSSESPTEASQDYDMPPDLNHGSDSDTIDPGGEATPRSQSQPEPSDACPPQSFGNPALPGVDLQTLLPSVGIAIKDFINENHITEEDREMVISALEKAAYVKDDRVYCKAENAERTSSVLSRPATPEAPIETPGNREPILMPSTSQAVLSGLNQPTTTISNNGELSLQFYVLSRKVDEMHAVMMGTSVVRPTTDMQHPTGTTIGAAPPALSNSYTKTQEQAGLWREAQLRLAQFTNRAASRWLSDPTSIPDRKVFVHAVIQFCDCEKWTCKAAYLSLANTYAELRKTQRNVQAFQASHQSILQDVQRQLGSSREELRVSAGKFAATVRALIAAVKESEKLQARSELLKAAVQQEEGKSNGYMGWYQAAQERHRQSQALYEAERARHQALLSYLGHAHPRYWQDSPNLASRPAPGFGKRPSLHPNVSPTPVSALTTFEPATIDTSRLEILPIFYPGEYKDEATDNDEHNGKDSSDDNFKCSDEESHEKNHKESHEENHKESHEENHKESHEENHKESHEENHKESHEENDEDTRTTEQVADAPSETDVHAKLETAEKERDEACNLYNQLFDDHETLLTSLMDPGSSRHLKYENIRLKKEIVMIPKLRSRVKQADQERDELLKLRREAAVHSEKAEEANALSLEHSRICEAFKNMKEENKTLKTDASAAGVAKLKQDLRKSNAQNDELKQTIKAMEEGQMITRTGVTSSDEKADPTTRIQLKTSTSTTTGSDSDENDPLEAHRFGLHKFQLTTTTANAITLSTTSTSSTYIKESVRLLKYLTKLHKTVLSRVHNISESRGGMGWSAFEQLEGLLQFMAKETKEASQMVLALDRSVAMDASGYPALAGVGGDGDGDGKEVLGEGEGKQGKKGKAKSGRKGKVVSLRLRD